MAQAQEFISQTQLVASTQQTRFHIQDGSGRNSEIRISGLDLAVLIQPVSSQKLSEMAGKVASKKKYAKHAQALDILVNAELKVKPDTCYGLVGRNGSGKSTLIRALSNKLIPGLPSNLKIAALQQTDNPSTHEAATQTSREALCIIDFVVHSDVERERIRLDMAVLCGNSGNPETSETQLRRYRGYIYGKMQAELLQRQNLAQLRSGSRGALARKELLIYEQEVESAKTRINEPPVDINSPSVVAELCEYAELVGRLQEDSDAISTTAVNQRARKILTGLGFTETMMKKAVNELSGGWRMRCNLAAVLAQDADLMILDEPTNFLDLLGIIWLQRYIEDMNSQRGRIIVLVSHDRAFIDETCQEIIILRDKALTYFKGNLTEYEADMRNRIKYLTRMQEVQDKEAERIGKTIRATIKTGKANGDDNKLRMAKSRQKKLENGAGMQVGSTGGRFKLSRDRAGFQDTKLAAIDIPTFEAGISLAVPVATELRHPGPLVSLENTSYAYSRGQTPLVIDSVSLSVPMGARIGIMGHNGAGKSTFVKLLTGSITPTSGQRTTHPQLKLGYYSQHAVEELQKAANVDPSMTALSKFTKEVEDSMTEQEIRGLLGSYGLQGQTVSHTPIKALSGGQLVRLAICSIIWKHPNLLVLDEISTHLDYHTVTALADAFAEFAGAIVLVSHDRYLMRRLIENSVEDDDGDDEDADGRGYGSKKAKAKSNSSEDGGLCARSVYSLTRGRLKVQDNGVAQFEKTVIARIAKLQL